MMQNGRINSPSLDLDYPQAKAEIGKYVHMFRYRGVNKIKYKHMFRDRGVNKIKYEHEGIMIILSTTTYIL